MKEKLPTLQENLRAQIQSGLSIELKFFSLSPERAHLAGQREGVTQLTLAFGKVPTVELEVREHHGQSYSRSQKAEMLKTLRAMQAAIEEAIKAKALALEEFPSAQDEEEKPS